MKRRILTVATVGLAMVTLMIAGILIAEPRLTPVKNGQAIYEKALKKLSSSYDLRVDKVTTIKVGDKTYKETSDITLLYRDMGTADQRIGLTETVKTGDTSISVSETYLQETVYLTVQDQYFSGALGADRAVLRYVSATLDESIYEKIDAYRSSGKIQIHFSSPTAPEAWAMPAGGELLDSSGIVYLDSNGGLSFLLYNVNYRYGNAEIKKEFQISIEPATEDAVTAPEDLDVYTPVDYIDGPVLLEKVCGLLLQEQSITAITEEYMFCGAFGDQRTKTDILKIQSLGPVEASIDTTISRSNTSHGDAPAVTKQYESFVGGVYSVSANNDPAEPNPAITDSYMKEYCQNLLLGTLIMPQYITDIRLTDSESSFFITYEADELFAQIITEDICNTLYADPTALSSRASGHTIQKIENVVEINKGTGLPRSASILYHGYYTIDDVSYPLKYEITQIYE